MSGHRIQVTVFLEPDVHRAAKHRAGEMKLSLSATVAEAAKESLLSSYRSDREKEILKAVERNFFALRRLEQRMRIELQVLKELIGLGIRSFFNHVPPVPETGKAAALLSGKQRFIRYLDMVAANLRGGESVLGDVPLLTPEETSSGAIATSQVQPLNAAPAAPGTKQIRHRSDRAARETATPKKGGENSDLDGQIGLFDHPKPGRPHGT